MKLPPISRNVLTILLAALLCVNGCDNSPPQAKIENPLAGQVEALEKAKDLEKQLHDAAEKQREALDKLSK